MNTTYKSVWNESLGAWVATSETTKARGKRSGVSITAAAVIALMAAGAATPLYAQYNAGGATVSASAGSIGIGTGAVAIGSNTVAIGTGSGTGNAATNFSNTFVGNATGQNVTGAGNVAVGREAGQNVTGGSNTTSGIFAGQNVTGIENTSMGASSGQNVTGNGNSAFGDGAGNNVVGVDVVNAGVTTTGGRNTAIGNKAGVSVTGNSNSAYGDGAGQNVTGDRNSAAGIASGQRVIGDNNVANGAYAGQDVVAQTQVIGGVTYTGGGNTAIGHSAGISVTGNSNTGIGDLAGQHVTGNANIALGSSAGVSVIADNTVSIGTNATGSGDKSIAIGVSATASAVDGVALGDGATAATANSVALGHGSTTAAAVGTSGVTLNGTAYTFAGAAPIGTVSVGTGVAGGERTITNVAAGQISATSTDAINGSELYATNQAVSSIQSGGGIKYFHANSVLADSQATGLEAVAVGPLAVASGAESTAMGVRTHATGDQSFALGVDASSSGTFSAAVGYAANASALAGVALGDNANAGGSSNSVAIGNHANASADNSVAVGSTSVASGTGSSAFGNQAKALGATSLALGQSANAGGASALALGMNAAAGATNSIAVGLGANASNVNGVALGVNSVASAYGGVAVGVAATVSATDGVAVGDGATASAANSAALGNGATASTANSVALGHGSTTAAAIATPGVALNGTNYTFAGAAPTGVVSVGSAGNERQIQNVAAGQISATSTDAINGSELFATNQAVTSLANGGTGPLQYSNPATPTTPNGGTRTQDMTLVGGAAGPVTLHNLAPGVLGNDAVNLTQLDAVAAASVVNYLNVNSTITGAGSNTKANSGATGIDAIAIGASAQASKNSALAIGSGAVAGTSVGDVALGSGSVTSTTINTINTSIGGVVTQNFAGIAAVSTVSVGTVGNERTITNVAAGRISATSTDAINGSELFATNKAIASLNTGGAGPVRYSDPASPTTPNGGTPTQDLTLVGAAAGPVTLHNVAPGTHATDAVDVGQLLGLATGLGGGASIDPTTGNVTGPTYVTYNSDGTTTTVNNVGDVIDNINAQGIKYFHANSTGADSQALGADSVAIGTGAKATNANDVALGAGSTSALAVGTGGATIAGAAYGFAGASPIGTVSVGAPGTERTITNVAAGRLSATSTDAVNGSQLYATNLALNSLNTEVQNLASGHFAGAPFQTSTDVPVVQPAPTGTTSVAGGSGAVASGNNSAAIGNNTLAAGTNSTALGNGATASNAGDVALGSNSVTDAPHAGITALFGGTAAGTANNNGAVSVGSVGNERQIQNVGAGVLSQTSTDAVNGSQLYTVKTGVDALGNSTAANLGGGAAYDANTGKVSSPTYNVYGANANNVGAAINALQASAPLQYSDSKGVATPTKPSNDVTLVGADTTKPVTLHNVAPGVAPTDAVDVQQLNNAITSANNYTDSAVNVLGNTVEANRKIASAGTAGAMAMAGMPQANIPGKSMVAAGVATYDGQSAIAVGISSVSDNGRWVVKFNGSAGTSGKVGVSAGAGFHW
jgi:trimeric autotransporter adhesin